MIITDSFFGVEIGIIDSLDRCLKAGKISFWTAW